MNDETSALSWAVAAGARGDDVRYKWRWGQAAEVPIGALWDVVRVTRTIGEASLARLTEWKTELGPVLEVPLRGTIEFLVERGCAANWPPMHGTWCVNDGEIRWPAPAMNVENGRRALCARRWIVPPDTRRALTDGNELVKAVAAALARL